MPVQEEPKGVADLIRTRASKSARQSVIRGSLGNITMCADG